MIEAQWTVWRLVLEGVATLEELDTHWSLIDAYRAHLALDYRCALSAWQAGG